MLFTTPEQRRVRLDFPCAGPFGPLGRPKDIRERLEENTCERWRLETAVNTMTSESENSPNFCRWAENRSILSSWVLRPNAFGYVTCSLWNRNIRYVQNEIKRDFLKQQLYCCWCNQNFTTFALRLLEMAVPLKEDYSSGSAVSSDFIST